MPRTERALGGEDSEVVRFAVDLRRLRQKAGSPTYRELARRVHYSSTTLSDAAGGRRLPTLEVALAFVRACDGDEAEWERRWRTATAVAPEVAGVPYPGLAAFQVEDTDRFFGRGALVDEVVDRVVRDRFVAVVGASGVGKSSLLRAGVVARLCATLEDTDVVVLTPGATPAAELAARPAVRDRARILVIDQFEEVFTLCQDRAEQARFIADVVAAAASDRVLIGLRADFYAHCADHPELRSMLTGAQVLVGAMSSAELRQAVVEPAERAGCTVEGQMVAAVVADAAGRAAVLPMVSHALLETWHRRRGTLLTLADYRAAGGIEGALAQTAEDRYGAMDTLRQRLTRALFLRLTALGEGTEDTRRRIVRAELDLDDPDLSAVLAVLADARLITLDESTVELTHEALITAWPRLHRWLAEDRDDLRAHRRLTEAVHTWQTLDHDPSALYRGAQLMTAVEWADRDGNRGTLNSMERAFLTASTDLETSNRRTTARRLRQLRWLTAGVALLLVVVTGITVVALDQSRQAGNARETAISRQLATQAQALVKTRPDTAMLLGVQAFRTAPTAEARGALLGMSTHTAYRTEFKAHDRAVSELAFTPDGRTLVSVGEDHTIALWNTRDRARVATVTEHDTWLRALAVSPDGAYLATGGDDRAVVLWHMASRVRTATLSGHTGAVKEAVFSPDGRLLATGGTDDTVIVWDIARRAAVARLSGHGGAVNSVAFSPDGTTIVAAGIGQVVLWDVDTGTRERTLTGHTGVVYKVAYSRTGLLASSGIDSTVRLWHPDGSQTELTGHEGAVMALAFSRDGATLASAGSDTTVRLWDVRDKTLRTSLTGHTTNVYALAFGPGAVLASAGESGSVIVWDTDRTTLFEPGTPNDIAFSPDGRILAVVGERITLWDTARRTRRAVLPGGAIANAVAFNADGTTFATAHDDGGVALWDSDGTLLARLTGHTAAVLDVMFSPDGRTLVSAGVDRTAVVWDVATRSRRTTLTSQDGAINGVTFSPDGRTLVTVSHDTTVMRWNTADWTPRGGLTGHTGWVRSAHFSPDGTIMATAGVDALRLWDVAAGSSQATLTGYVDAQVNGAAFSPDGATLAYTSGEHAISLWRGGAVVARLTGHTAPVRAVVFSPDGTELATVADDDTVLLWDMDPEQVADRICTALGRGLTGAERAQFVPEEPEHGGC